MTNGRKQTILSDLSVREAMRRQIVHLSKDASLDECINRLFKYKMNALLLTDETEQPTGVVSKTDIMGAYYAGLPVESPASDIMISPPLFCSPDDSLEAALEQMRENGIYRLYVRDTEDGVVGALAYPDIVGLLYKYCHECRYSRVSRKSSDPEEDSRVRFRVREVMTASVMSFQEADSLMQIMEGLSMYRFGAVLITDENGKGAGVVSKTDLVLAYKHGVDPAVEAQTVMSSPVRSCQADEYLESAIRKLIFSQVHRMFVYQDDPSEITGVLSLSDAARIRSGSCQACVSSRIKVAGDDAAVQ